MSRQRKLQLKELIASRVRKVADPGLQALAASILAAFSDAQLAAIAQRATSSVIPPVIEQLRTKMTATVTRIEADIERKDRERALLGRSSSDDLIWQLEEAMQTAMDMMRRLLPEAALSHANIEFSESVPLPIARDLHTATEQSEKAQEALFMKSISYVREVMDSLYDETSASLSAADKSMGGGVFRKPARFVYRPPQHFFIGFYLALDRYEMVRVTTQGMSQINAIRPRWLGKLLLRLPKIAGMELGEIIGGVSGFDSLSETKRVQLRRELTSIAAEHRRRILLSAQEQASAFFRDLKSNVLAQSRSHYYTTFDTITKLLSELNKERRQALDYWGTTERSLREAEGYSRELLALTSAAEREAACIT